MKAATRVISVSFLAGLFLTVAVAWGCIAWSKLFLSGAMLITDSASATGSGSGTVTLSGGFVTLYSGNTTIHGGGPGWGWQLEAAARDGVSHTTHSAWSAGWPWRALHGEYHTSGSGPLTVSSAALGAGTVPIGWRTGFPVGWGAQGTGAWGERRLPLIPSGVGFGLDVLFWTGMVGASSALWHAIRTRTRRRAGRCRRCAYDLAGNTTGVCPECGQTNPNARPASADGATA